MIYRFLKILSRITVFSYFHKLEINGSEHLKIKQPVIIVANHPSSFMDPIILAVILRFKLYFIVAAEYVGKGLQKAFFQRFFHMIPVYRPTTKPTDNHKNKDMFQYCYTHLNEKKSLLIFPEGISVTSDHLHPLKTGVARIAIGAEEEAKNQLDLTILPIGLNYSDPHTFRSNLLINIADPIKVNEVIKQSTDKTEQINLVMSKIREKLENSVLHIEEVEDTTFLKQINSLLRFFESTRPDSEEDKFIILKKLNGFLNHFSKNETERLENFRLSSEKFFSFLEKENLDLKAIHIHTKINSTKNWMILIFGFPLFLFGILLNYIPYRLVGIINDKLKLEKTFSGAISLSLGMVLFLIWYSVISIIFGIVYLDLWAIFVPFIAYTVGIYSLLYLNLLKTLYTVNRTVKKLKKNKDLNNSFNESLTELKNSLLFFQDILIKEDLDI